MPIGRADYNDSFALGRTRRRAVSEWTSESEGIVRARSERLIV